MYKTKLNKIGNLIENIKNDISIPLISDFLVWFYEKLDIIFNKKIENFDLQKGDIFYINLGKNIGSELNKNRPCIIFSKKFANKGDTVVIIPLKSFKGKSNTDIYILIKTDNENKLIKDSIADITGIKQVSKKRINGYIGKINNETLSKINKKIVKIFDIKNKEYQNSLFQCVFSLFKKSPKQHIKYA